MPNKYSHGLVLSQQYYWGTINTHLPPSSKPLSSLSSTSQTHSTTASLRHPSDYSTRSSGYSDYLRLEPEHEPELSYIYTTSTHTSRPSDASRFESTAIQRSNPPSHRLRLDPSFDSRIENPPSPPAKLEPSLSEPLHYESRPSYPPNLESSPSERLRLDTSSPPRPRNPRPTLHRKSSSVETRIYAPKPNTPTPPTQDGLHQFAIERHETYPSPPLTHDRQHHSPIPTPQEHQSCPSRPPKIEIPHGTSREPTQERQHVFSMEPPESFPPPISSEEYHEEIPCARFPSTRSRRQSFIQRTQTRTSPSPVQGHQVHSPFGAQSSSQSHSTRELQDYFSIEPQGSHSTPSATEDLHNVSSMKTCSALSTPSKDDKVRPLVHMQRLQSPPQAQDHQNRPSIGIQRPSSERRSQTAQESVRGRRQSWNSQTRLGRQYPPSVGHRQLSSNRSNKETRHGRREPIDLKTAQERQPRRSSSSQRLSLEQFIQESSSSSQQLSLEQFIQESEQIGESPRGSQVLSPPLSSTYMEKLYSNTLANAQRYTPKSSPNENIPRSRRDRASKLPHDFASQHMILLPNGQGTYENVMIEAHGFPHERPPSPPATPDSSKNFSLTPQTEEIQSTRPPPPIPQRSARRSSSGQQSTLRSTNSSVSLPSETPRPKTSSVIDPPTNTKEVTPLHSSTPSISPRKSSINATLSPRSVSFSNFSETMTSPRRSSFSKPGHRDQFEYADLKALPSEIDFNVLPYEDPNAGPAIFRATQLGLENPVSARYENCNSEPALSRATRLGLEKPVSPDRPVSSRASSFDSAAPPPIGLGRRISHAVAEPHRPRTPKKERKMSLRSILRSLPAPKAVPYSEATQGEPPVHVSASRCTASSIPLLFPGYRGQFPPQQKTQDKDPNGGPEPTVRLRLDETTGPPRSVCHPAATEKRRSWFKSDGADKSHEADRSVRRGELEKILSCM